MDVEREHQFNEKRLVSSTIRPHEPRRCLNNTCMNDVHMTSPQDKQFTITITTMTNYTTQPQRVGALLPMPSCLGIGDTSVGHGKDHQCTVGPLRREAVGGPNNVPKCGVTRYDASFKQDNRKVFRQTWQWSGDDKMLKEFSERVTTNQLEQNTVEVPQEQIVKTTPMTQQVTDQSATIEQLNTRED